MPNRYQSGKCVFISFEYDHDYPRARTLIGQARGRGYPKPVFDVSLEEQYQIHNDKWVREASKRIKSSQLVVVLLGPNTHNAPGVAKEIQIAKDRGKQIIQIRPQRTRWSAHPLLSDKEVITWRWKRLDRYFDSNYGKR